jgi:uroporphyrinogen-III synthase
MRPLVAAGSRGEVHALTVSSGGGVRNLRALLGESGRRLFETLPLFVPHARVDAEARKLGAAAVIVAGPTNDEMLESLVAYFRKS